MEDRTGTEDEIFRVSLETDGELLFKSRAVTEGDDRFVYCEPSNPNRDIQREVVERAAAPGASQKAPPRRWVRRAS